VGSCIKKEKLGLGGLGEYQLYRRRHNRSQDSLERVNPPGRSSRQKPRAGSRNQVPKSTRLVTFRGLGGLLVRDWMCEGWRLGPGTEQLVSFNHRDFG